MLQHAFMRAVDKWVGEAIILGLRPVDLGARLVGQPVNREIRRIAVSKYFGLGSIILATPLLAAIRERFPNATIVFVTSESNRDLLLRYPFVDQVYAIRTSGFGAFALDTLKVLLALRAKRPDVFIDMEFFARYSALIALLSGAPIRIGFHALHLRRGRLLTHRIRYNPNRHVSEAFLALGWPLSLTGGLLVHPPEVRPDEEREVERRLHALGVDEFIVLSPGIGDDNEYRRWPVENWSCLVKFLATSKLQSAVVFTGTRRDFDTVQEIVSKSGVEADRPAISVHNLAGQLTLGEFLALLLRARLVVTLDGGTLHAASALMRPTVSLFGPDTPVTYGPLGVNHKVIYKDLYCSPCYNLFEAKRIECWWDCGRCMKLIEPSEVLEAVLEQVELSR